MEYNELIPNVYWNSDPSSNTNLLILCHLQQINYYMPMVKKYIWSKYGDVTVWNTKFEIQNTKQLFNEIENMDAIIVLASELFISTEHEIGDLAVPYALSKGIPILPILLGDELEFAFDKKYGHIHYIKSTDKINSMNFQRCVDDFIQHINKKEKWGTFQPSSIYKNNPFSQTYFISYRKKDGRYVDVLQKKIHDDSKLLDTQLWYDTYLTPGENYDENLIRMIDKCDALILIVTPQLFEPDNYVLRTELPYAKSCGKKIIAIQMEETDWKSLESIQESYTIDQVYRLEEWNCFSEILEDAGLSIPDLNPCAQHLYELGISYLAGDIAECNRHLGCSLLYQAAESGYYSAYETLIEVMIGNYDSSYKNDLEAIELFEKYNSILKVQYSFRKDKTSLKKLFEYTRKFGEFYFEQNNFENAYCLFHLCYEYVKDVSKKDVNEFYTYLSVACLKLGKTLNALKKFDEAEVYYRKAVKIDGEVYDNKDMSLSNSRTLINSLTSLCEMGSFYQERGLLLKAKIAYEEVITTIRNYGCVYGMPWNDKRVFIGYEDEYAAQNVQELSKYAMISILQINSEFQQKGIYHPKKKKYSRENITDLRILDQNKDAEIQLLSHEIMLNTIEKCKWLIAFVSKYDIDFDLCQNKYCVNAKSLLGVLSLDIQDSYELIIHSDLKTAESIMKKIVERLNSIEK